MLQKYRRSLIDAARPGFMAAFDNPLDLSAERDAMQRELDETGVIAGLEDLKKIGSAIVSA